jgi:Tetracyclin repressor-like, C-terminal domain
MTIEFNGANADNVRRAPRRVIDTHTRVKPDARLVGEGGTEALLPEARSCEEPSVWPTSQQPIPPSEEGLINALLEQHAHEHINPVRDFLTDESDPGAQLKHLISRLAKAVAQRRGSLPVFFAGDGFPCEVIVKGRKWSRQLEEQWASVVGACMNLGYLDAGDTFITTRLILGMIISVAQQSPPAEQMSAEQITHAVVTLLRLEPGSSLSK